MLKCADFASFTPCGDFFEAIGRRAGTLARQLPIWTIDTQR
jgi:hypothetical protein